MSATTRTAVGGKRKLGGSTPTTSTRRALSCSSESSMCSCSRWHPCGATIASATATMATMSNVRTRPPRYASTREPSRWRKGDAIPDRAPPLGAPHPGRHDRDHVRDRLPRSGRSRPRRRRSARRRGDDRVDPARAGARSPGAGAVRPLRRTPRPRRPRPLIRHARAGRRDPGAPPAATGLGIAIVIGLAGGLVTAPLAGTWVDRAALVSSLALLSAPVFWLGMLALYYVGYRWRLLPLGGAGDVRHLVLPALVLGSGTGVYYARLLHTNLVGVLGADYVRAARARGASELRVVAVHALRNASLPLLTVIGLDFAALLNGVVLTETVFHWPGLGRLAFDAVLSLDVPVIMGTVLLSAFLVVASNLAIDLLYRVVDPRIRLG